jgi:hypothetical protein
MKTQHTPGPFEVRPASNPKNGTGWRDIVSVGTVFSPSYVGEALEQDAYLFAASPDLLAACKTAKAFLMAHHELEDQATQELADELNEAIAKAEGGSQ